ncbi:MAG: hypothetical protein J7M38_03195 [Armatimonadetes bacterium]|nr:hypothetical protein [Armatimonadota bacterium]
MKAGNLTRAMAALALLAIVGGGCRKPEYVTPEQPLVPPPAAEGDAAAQALSDRQAAQAVATFLGLGVGDVTTESVSESPVGYVIEAEIASRSGENERVRIECARDLLLLRSCRWLNKPPEGKPTLNAEHAKLVAQVLYDRWFPDVPVNMAREALAVDEKTFVVNWVARLAPDIYSGDRVMALISAVDGHPLYYEQYVARERPDIKDIPVTAQQALKTARRAFETSRYSGRKVASTKELLLLSAPQSRKGDPLWFVEFTLAGSGGGESEPPCEIAVNGYTGAVETDLLEVFEVE